MFRRSQTKTIALIAVVLIFVGFTGGVTWLLYQRFFQGGGQSTETRSRASGPTGDVKIRLVAEAGSRYVKDEFIVKVMMKTSGKYVSGVAFGLNYKSGTGTTPVLEVMDSDTTQAGVQIEHRLGAANPCFGEKAQVNIVSRGTTGDKTMLIDYSAPCVSAEGFRTDEEVEVARIKFRANTAVADSILISMDPEKAQARDKETGGDILETSSPLEIAIKADTEKPTALLDSSSLDANDSTVSGKVFFKLKSTDAPQRQSDALPQTMQYSWRFNTEAFSAWNTSSEVSKTLNHGPTQSIEFKVRDANLNESPIVKKAFGVNLKPTISKVTPNEAAGGKEIVIDGFNFGAKSNIILFGTTKVSGTSIKEWTDSRVRVIVPTTAVGGTVAVQPYGTGTPASDAVAFKLLSQVRLVLNMQGYTEDRGEKKVDVTFIQSGKKRVMKDQKAVWNATEKAYEVITEDVGNVRTDVANDVALIAGKATVSVKDASRLRKNLGTLTIAKGTLVSHVKKAAADQVKIGDFTGDNNIDLADWGYMMKYVKASTNAITTDNKAVDVNGDGTINLFDIALVLSNYTSLIVKGDAE